MSGSSDGSLPFPDRRSRLREGLRDPGLDGLLVSHPPNVRYLTGFGGSTGLLLVLADSALLVVDGRYAEQAVTEADRGVEVREAAAGLMEALGEALGDGEAALRAGFEAEHTTVTGRDRLEEEAGGADWRPTEGLVEELRSRKDPDELDRMGRAARAAERAWEGLVAVLEEGMSEREAVAEMDYRLRREGTGPPAFDTIVAFGERSALPHARPGDRRLREGDLVLVDGGATVDAYCSDLTRMACAGPPADWQRELHGAVDDARAAAVAAVGDGRPAREVDAAARERLAASGRADAFSHSTGHGLGLEVHERPSVSSRSDEILRGGNVVTIEPGVYLRGRGGIRLEDDVAVEADGSRLLTTADRGLREL